MNTAPPPLIVHVLHRFAVGGLENGVVNLINRMPAAHWRHAVVALTQVDPAFAARLQRSDVDCIALNKPPGQGLWLYPRMHALLRRLQPDIVHTRNLAALEMQVPAWAAGVPGRVHSEHGWDVDDLHGRNPRHRWMRRAYRPFVQQQIALGTELTAYLRGRIGVPAQRLSTIWNGVDTVRFHPAASGRAHIPGCPFSNTPAAPLWLVGTVGRMQTVKAQPLLVRAFIAALQRQPALRQTLRLVLVGDGPLRAECQTLLQAAGMADLAWLAGERNDVPEVMRGLDCFVLPSLAEGISNTILEAMASGLPVLATAVGSNAELLGDHSGTVVAAGDAQALADGLLQLATDRAAAAAMGRHGRTRVEQHYSLPAMVSAYEAAYRRVLPVRQPSRQTRPQRAD